MAQTQRQLTKTAVKAIMKSRDEVPESLIGKKVMLTIQGNGVIIDVKNAAGEAVQSVVEPGTVFQKVIFNCKANSGLAMKNIRNLAFWTAGKAAEAAGNSEEAHEAYSDFLNSVQLSFSVPTTSSIKDQLSNGVDISAKVIEIKTENGSLLTIDPATIGILAPAVLGKTTFSFDDEDAAVPANEVEALKA